MTRTSQALTRCAHRDSRTQSHLLTTLTTETCEGADSWRRLVCCADTATNTHTHGSEVIALYAYNITSAWVVDWELFDTHIYIYIYIPFGFLWVSLERLWLPLGFDFFGRPWATFDRPLVPFGVPLGSLWLSFGVPCAVLGHMEPC